MFTKNQVTDAVATYEFEARRIATRPHKSVVLLQEYPQFQFRSQ